MSEDREVETEAPREAATPRGAIDEPDTERVAGPAAPVNGNLEAAEHTNGTGDEFSPRDAARLYHVHHLVPIPWRVVNGRKKPTIRAWNDPSQRPAFDRLSTEFARREVGVGLVTGRPGGGRIIVVDVEGPKKEIPGDPTPFLDTTPCIARTPSGGWHFFYSDDRDADDAEIQSRAGVLPGVDVRADRNGYVAVWPSRGYRWEAGLPVLLAGMLPGFSTVRHLLVKPATTAESREAPTEPWIAKALSEPVPLGEQRETITRLAGFFIERREAQDIIVATLWPRVQTWPQREGDPWTKAAVEAIVEDITKKDAEAKGRAGEQGDAEPPMPTDVTNAARLVVRYGDIIAWVPSWKTWLAFDGRRWAPDETGTEVMRLAKGVVRGLCVEAGAIKRDAARRDFLRECLRSQSDPRMRGMVNQAKSEPGIVRRPEDFDADDFVLNVENGTINLHTGDFRAGHKPDALVTMVAPVEYDPTADCPTFKAFLRRIMGEREDAERAARLVAYVQRLFGYILSGSTREHVFVFLHGSTGQNGKTTLIESFRGVLGDYAKNADLDTFLVTRRGQVRSDLARLAGARLVTAAEGEEGDQLATALIKRFTGGDKLTARQLYKAEEEFAPKGKLIVATNHLPDIQTWDGGLRRRVHVVPFTVRIPDEERDEGLPAKLMAEAPGILRWGVEGCLAWQREGLGVPSEVHEAVKQYEADTDPLEEFLEARCTRDEGADVEARQLHDAYTGWFQGPRHRVLTFRQLNDRLRGKGFHDGLHPTTRRKVWLRVGLRPLSVLADEPAGRVAAA